MKPVAIFRFSPTEGPGHFAEWLDAHAVPFRLVAIDRGEGVPADPRAFAGVGMMGGPMSANDDLPWNAPLLQFIQAAVTAGVPVIGHCLGGQLLAKALGGAVSRALMPEIGWGKVSVVPPGNAWFAGRGSFTTFQWHYEMFGLPPGATRVLTNNFNPNQAFALGKHIGFQCHIEMTRDLVDTWCQTGAAELASQSGPAIQDEATIRFDLDARLADLARVADAVYAHWSRQLLR